MINIILNENFISCYFYCFFIRAYCDNFLEYLIGLKGLIRRPIHSYVSAQSCYAKVGQ